MDGKTCEHGIKVVAGVLACAVCWTVWHSASEICWPNTQKECRIEQPHTEQSTGQNVPARLTVTSLAGSAGATGTAVDLSLVQTPNGWTLLSRG